MKQTLSILLVLGVSLLSKAQMADYPENEIKLNIVNTIAIASIEFGYERFIGFNQSIEAEALINDRFSYHSQKGSRDFKTNSFKLGYVYYFSNDKAGSGVYANPFLKYRTGDFTQEVELQGQSLEVKTDMDSFIMGIGVGYKFNSNDKFIIAPFVNIGRNFSDEVNDRFSAIEFNGGISVGFRF